MVKNSNFSVRREGASRPAKLVAIGIVVVALQAFSDGGQLAADGAATTFYAAPEARGEANGANPADAAKWNDRSFWNTVQEALGTADVVVNLLDGAYYVSSREGAEMPALSLSRLGHDEHHLTVQGVSIDGVTITRYPDDGTSRSEGAGLVSVSRSRNMTLRNLHFTAPGDHWIGYAVLFERSRDILIDSCSWIDMPNVHYGATGAHREESFNIVYKNCRFVRIGKRSGAHMAYNAYGARGISYIDCTFEDCAGDYIRFRSQADYGVVAGCTFRSTGGHVNTHMPFVSIPLFNNVDPGDELFGTRFLIFDNTFEYETDENPEGRIAIRFLHRGFDPPDRRHLLDKDEAAVLESSSAGEKRELLLKNLGVDTRTVHVFGNRYHNVDRKGVYDVRANYGAETRGGDGIYDIFDTFNSSPVVTARDYWRFFGGVLGAEDVEPGQAP